MRQPRERGERPEREPIDPMVALERLVAKSVISMDEAKAAAQFIDPNAPFPPPPKPPAAPAAEPGAPLASAPPPDPAPQAGENGGAPNDRPSD